VPFTIGLWPLSSDDLARRLHHEVPGIVIPEPVQEHLRLAGDQAKEEGWDIVEELWRNGHADLRWLAHHLSFQAL
jgi:5,10-methylenetetrahydrofolate reductase